MSNPQDCQTGRKAKAGVVLAAHRVRRRRRNLIVFGGDHSATWTNCVIDNKAVGEGSAVDSREHWAVGISYNPGLPPQMWTRRLPRLSSVPRSCAV